MIWNPLQWFLEAYRRAQVAQEACSDEDEPHLRAGDGEDNHLRHGDPEIVEQEETDPPYRLRHVGAWVGRSTFQTNDAIARDIKFCVELGLTRLDVIVNDHSASRSPRDFDTYNKSRIAVLAHEARKVGIEIHLMSWWMPHETYIRQGAVHLRDLVELTGAKTVMLDAEEPWTQAKAKMPYEAAAILTMDELQKVVWGVTAIGYASVPKLAPLIQRSAYMVPQCYATSNNKLDPATVAPHLCGRWRNKFQVDLPFVIGLAGYRQAGRIGYSKSRFMTLAFDGALSQKPTDIVYWSLRHLRSSPSTAKIIKTLTQRRNS